MKKPTVLMILDGFGINPKKEFNAIKTANKPNFDKIVEKYPHVQGNASGLYVGLPDGQMGNSEVGHLNIGAGRIVYQELTRITKAIEDGDFFENEALVKAMKNCADNDKSLHLMGLVSDGGVHSHNTHLYALVEMAKRFELKKVFIHAYLDGRDTPPTSGEGYLMELEEKLSEIGVGEIADISGRYYGMDRDNRWEREEKAYNMLVLGEGKKFADVKTAIETSYEAGDTDEFVLPSIITDKNGNPKGLINDGDSVIFFNFRPDRARQLTRIFCDKDFSGFEKKKSVSGLTFVTFTEYDKTITDKIVAFAPQTLKNTMGEYISSLGLKQLRLAETEKYAHVTFFFNGGVEEPNPGEDRILIPSPKVATYDLKPEMSAYEVTEALVKNILEKSYDLIIINYANTDMVGHTGVMEAAVKAVEAIDECIGKVYEALMSVDGQMFICADHGNSDQMKDYVTGEPHTAHTTNPVPFILVNYKEGVGLRDGGSLCDIAPTLLEMMDIKIPEEMTGKSLLVNK